MTLKWNMDNDEQVYIGDTGLGVKGLLNYTGVVVTNAVKTWANSSNDEILDSINSLLSASWAQSGYAVCPQDLGLPPAKLSLLASRKVSEAGNISLLTYLRENTITFTENGTPLDIRAMKWLNGAGAGGTDRMIAYTNDEKFVRYPLVPLMNTPVEYRGIHQITTYYGKMGAVEAPYKETIAYMDGI